MDPPPLRDWRRVGSSFPVAALGGGDSGGGPPRPAGAGGIPSSTAVALPPPPSTAPARGLGGDGELHDSERPHHALEAGSTSSGGEEGDRSRRHTSHHRRHAHRHRRRHHGRHHSRRHRRHEHSSDDSGSGSEGDAGGDREDQARGVSTATTTLGATMGPGAAGSGGQLLWVDDRSPDPDLLLYGAYRADVPAYVGAESSYPPSLAVGRASWLASAAHAARTRACHPFKAPATPTRLDDASWARTWPLQWRFLYDQVPAPPAQGCGALGAAGQPHGDGWNEWMGLGQPLPPTMEAGERARAFMRVLAGIRRPEGGIPTGLVMPAQSAAALASARAQGGIFHALAEEAKASAAAKAGPQALRHRSGGRYFGQDEHAWLTGTALAAATVHVAESGKRLARQGAEAGGGAGGGGGSWEGYGSSSTMATAAPSASSRRLIDALVHSGYGIVVDGHAAFMARDASSRVAGMDGMEDGSPTPAPTAIITANRGGDGTKAATVVVHRFAGEQGHPSPLQHGPPSATATWFLPLDPAQVEMRHDGVELDGEWKDEMVSGHTGGGTSGWTSFSPRQEVGESRLAFIKRRSAQLARLAALYAHDPQTWIAYIHFAVGPSAVGGEDEPSAARAAAAGAAERALAYCDRAVACCPRDATLVHHRMALYLHWKRACAGRAGLSREAEGEVVAQWRSLFLATPPLAGEPSLCLHFLHTLRNLRTTAAVATFRHHASWLVSRIQAAKAGVLQALSSRGIMVSSQAVSQFGSQLQQFDDAWLQTLTAWAWVEVDAGCGGRGMSLLAHAWEFNATCPAILAAMPLAHRQAWYALYCATRPAPVTSCDGEWVVDAAVHAPGQPFPPPHLVRAVLQRHVTAPTWSDWCHQRVEGLSLDEMAAVHVVPGSGNVDGEAPCPIPLLQAAVDLVVDAFTATCFPSPCHGNTDGVDHDLGPMASDLPPPRTPMPSPTTTAAFSDGRSPTGASVGGMHAKEEEVGEGDAPVTDAEAGDGGGVEWVYSTIHGHRIPVQRGGVLGLSPTGKLELIDVTGLDKGAYAQRLRELHYGVGAGTRASHASLAPALLVTRMRMHPQPGWMAPDHPFARVTAYARSVQCHTRWPSTWQWRWEGAIMACPAAIHPASTLTPCVTMREYEAVLDSALQAMGHTGADTVHRGGWMDVGLRERFAGAYGSVRRQGMCIAKALSQPPLGHPPHPRTQLASPCHSAPLQAVAACALHDMSPPQHLPALLHLLSLHGVWVDEGMVLPPGAHAPGVHTPWLHAFRPPPTTRQLDPPPSGCLMTVDGSVADGRTGWPSASAVAALLLTAARTAPTHHACIYVALLLDFVSLLGRAGWPSREAQVRALMAQVEVSMGANPTRVFGLHLLWRVVMHWAGRPGSGSVTPDAVFHACAGAAVSTAGARPSAPPSAPPRLPPSLADMAWHAGWAAITQGDSCVGAAQGLVSLCHVHGGRPMPPPSYTTAEDGARALRKLVAATVATLGNAMVDACQRVADLAAGSGGGMAELAFLPAWPMDDRFQSHLHAVAALPALVGVMALCRYEAGGGGLNNGVGGDSSLTPALDALHKGAHAVAGVARCLSATIAHVHGEDVVVTGDSGVTIPAFSASAMALDVAWPPPPTQAPLHAGRMHGFALHGHAAPPLKLPTAVAAALTPGEWRDAVLHGQWHGGGSSGSPSMTWPQVSAKLRLERGGHSPLRHALHACATALHTLCHMQYQLVAWHGNQQPATVPPSLRRAVVEAWLTLFPASHAALSAHLNDAALGSVLQRMVTVASMASEAWAWGDAPTHASMMQASLHARLAAIVRSAQGDTTGTPAGDGAPGSDVAAASRSLAAALTHDNPVLQHTTHLWRWTARLLLVAGDPRSAFLMLQRALTACPFAHRALSHDVCAWFQPFMPPEEADTLVASLLHRH